MKNKLYFIILLFLAAAIQPKEQEQEKRYILCEFRGIELVEVSKPLKLHECKKKEKRGRTVCVEDLQFLIIEEEKDVIKPK